MQWGKFIRLVPHPVMLGLCERPCDRYLLGSDGPVQGARFCCGNGHGMAGGEWLSGGAAVYDAGSCAATMAIIWVMPRITKCIPAPLAGIGIVALWLLVSAWTFRALAIWPPFRVVFRHGTFRWFR